MRITKDISKNSMRKNALATRSMRGAECMMARTKSRIVRKITTTIPSRKSRAMNRSYMRSLSDGIGGIKGEKMPVRSKIADFMKR